MDRVPALWWEEACVLEVHRLTKERESDFWGFQARVPEHSCDHTGWCFCVAWWVEPVGPEAWSGWGERSAEQNRELRQELLDRGEHDGYLLYRDGRVDGWCQVGPRDRLPRLRALYGLTSDPATWAVTCFMLRPEARGQGLARALLEAVLADLRCRGVARVEAFPKRGTQDPNELWTGPERLFRRAGFTVSQEDERRPVLALSLA